VNKLFKFLARRAAAKKARQVEKYSLKYEIAKAKCRVIEKRLKETPPTEEVELKFLKGRLKHANK
jgi:hypothetical protein